MTNATTTEAQSTAAGTPTPPPSANRAVSKYPFRDAPVIRVNWDEDEVPEGYVDVTVRIPETRIGWSAKTRVDLIVKEVPNA